MSAFVTARRLLPNSDSFEYVLMKDGQVVANLQRHSTVTEAYEFGRWEAERESDWRSAGYLKPNWSVDVMGR